MFSSIKILLRDIVRNKTFFLIKTVGLTIGLTSFILIYLFIQYEKSYDTFHSDYQNIYRIITQYPGSKHRGSDIFCITPGPLVPLIKKEFPEVLYASRVFKRQRLVNYHNTSAIEPRVLYVDPDFLRLFSFKLLSGNSEDALNNPNSIILTSKSAEKYFGIENPIGKTMIIDEDQEYMVTGIIENTPDNSHIKFDFLSTIGTSINYDNPSYHWNSMPYQAYIRFKNNQPAKAFEDKLNKVCNLHRNNNDNELFAIQALTDIHLNGNYNDELEKNGNKKQVYSFFIIGISILLIACFNYVNITSAHSFNKLKSAGIKKIIGAKKHQLFFRIIGESVFYFFISTCISAFMVYISLTYLNSFLQKEIPMKFLLEFEFLSVILLSIIFISLLSGLFPALIILKYNPIQIVKNGIQYTKDKFINIRSSLIVAQFIISIILVIVTLTVYKQLKYLQNKDLGYQKENIINTYIYDKDCRSKYATLKNELLKNSDIIDVTVSNYLPNDISGQTDIVRDGQNDEKELIYNAQVGANFLDFYGIQLKEGRSFSEANVSNTSLYILNQTAVESFKFNNPLGETITINGINGLVTGVIKDIHYYPMDLKIAPMAFTNMKEIDFNHKASYLSIKLNPQNIDRTLTYIEKTYSQFSPNYPFSYGFLDSAIDLAYISEKRFESLMKLFSIIAICIACLGLFGLAKYNLEKRIKEIGIRKINGAKVSEVLAMLNKDFIRLIVIAFVIACPIAWYAMHKWLQGFAYKTELSWWVFAAAGIAAVAVALLTVSWQSWRAATKNPVEALRYE